jgi:cytochrome P450 family 628
LKKYVDELVAQLDNLEAQSVNASLWFNFYSFDVMGDLAFGKSFNMLKSGEQHYALKLLVDGMHAIGILTPIPWILPLLLRIPGAANGNKIFTKFIEDQAASRRKVQYQLICPFRSITD